MPQKRSQTNYEGSLAETQPPKHKLPKTQDKGRVCEAFGCETGLSIYNPKTTCYRHQSPERPSGNARRWE